MYGVPGTTGGTWAPSLNKASADQCPHGADSLAGRERQVRECQKLCFGKRQSRIRDNTAKGRNERWAAINRVIRRSFIEKHLSDDLKEATG